MYFPECMGGLAEGESEVDPVGQAEGHDILIKFAEPEGGGVRREGVHVHAEEIYLEFPVDVVELVFIFAVVLLKVFPGYFFEVVEIVGASGVDAFMDDEMLPVFLAGERVVTVGAAQDVML